MFFITPSVSQAVAMQAGDFTGAINVYTEAGEKECFLIRMFMADNEMAMNFIHFKVFRKRDEKNGTWSQ